MLHASDLCWITHAPEAYVTGGAFQSGLADEYCDLSWPQDLLDAALDAGRGLDAPNFLPTGVKVYRDYSWTDSKVFQMLTPREE